MIHKYYLGGLYIVLDVNSGGVHIVDELTYDLLDDAVPPYAEECPQEIVDKLSAKYDPEKLKIHIMEDFRETVLAASRAAEPGDMVLLSPACASFDKFKNFEERGNTFRHIVMEME